MVQSHAIKKIVVIFLSDTHLGFDAPQNPRINRRRRGTEFFDNFLKALGAAGNLNADLVVHGGDLFYRSRIRDNLIGKAFQPMIELADQGLPVYLVPGNHERSHIKVTLFEQHPKIFTFDRPRTLRLVCRGISLSLSGFVFYRGNIRDSFRKL